MSILDCALLRLPWRDREAVVALVFAGMTAAAAFAGPSGAEATGAGAAPSFASLLGATSLLPALVVALGAVRCALSRVRSGALFGTASRSGQLKQWLTRGVALGLAAAAVCGALAAAIQSAMEACGLPAPPQASVAWLLSPATPVATKALLCAHAAFMAPVCEEILYRGILLPAALRAVVSRGCAGLPGRVAAVTAVSLLFALAHGSWVALAPLCMVGALCCLCALRTGSLVQGIALHATFNAVNLALLAFTEP